MSRFVVLSLPALALALLPACRPSRAQLEDMQARLAQLQSEQQELSARVQELSEREAGRDDAERFERSELEDALIDVAVRVARLEEQAAPTAERAARPSPGRPDPAAVYKVEVGDAPVRGPSDAPVTIVMWTDYQCPYCARVQATLAQLEEEYGRSVRFVHKHNPLSFHQRAMPAALAAEAAHRQGKFWKMHDRLFDNQKQLTDKNFRRWAKKMGLKVNRFEKDMDDPALRQRIEQDAAQGNTLGARGTPAFFVNGRFLSGAQPVESFRTLIDEELAKARRLVERGVPASEVYEVTIAEGRNSP